MQFKHYYPQPLEIRSKLEIAPYFTFLPERLKKLVSAESYDHATGRFASGPLPTRVGSIHFVFIF